MKAIHPRKNHWSRTVEVCSNGCHLLRCANRRLSVRDQWTLHLERVASWGNCSIALFDLWTTLAMRRHHTHDSSAVHTLIIYTGETWSAAAAARVVASTQSFKYQYQYHCTSTCSQYHAAASYRLVQNLKSTTKHNITYSRIYNNALQLTIDQTESDNHHTQINNLFSIFRQTV